MDTPTRPPTEQPARISLIVRDVVIVVAPTFIEGFVIGLAGSRLSQRGLLAIIVSNLLLETVGFVISGCLARGNRWRHLTSVALGVWLFGLVNVLFFGVGIVQWFSSCIAIGLMMGLGGALSYVFRRDDLPSPPMSRSDPGN